eukprot:4818579-Pleurochrysis_carterae.AAC.1
MPALQLSPNHSSSIVQRSATYAAAKQRNVHPRMDRCLTAAQRSEERKGRLLRTTLGARRGWEQQRQPT